MSNNVTVTGLGKKGVRETYLFPLLMKLVEKGKEPFATYLTWSAWKSTKLASKIGEFFHLFPDKFSHVSQHSARRLKLVAKTGSMSVLGLSDH